MPWWVRTSSAGAAPASGSSDMSPGIPVASAERTDTTSEVLTQLQRSSQEKMTRRESKSSSWPWFY